MQNNIIGQSDTTSGYSAQPKTLVVGLGNPILGDDGVGWKIAEQVEEKITAAIKTGNSPLIEVPTKIEYLSLGGLSLMEHLVGYQRVIIVDAMTTRQNPVGAVTSFPLDSLPDLSAGHLTAPHDTSLQTAIKVGRSMGAMLPNQIMIVAVEAEFVSDFSEELSESVAMAVPRAASIVMQQLIEWAQGTVHPSAHVDPEINA